jgi:hypothetical protein
MKISKTTITPFKFISEWLNNQATKDESIATNVTNTAFKKPINSFISSIFAINHYIAMKIKKQ